MDARGGKLDRRAGLVAIDWGTTYRRLYLLDPALEVVAKAEDDRGIGALAPADIPAEIDTLRARYGRPLLLAGMIGSRSGWRETPYLPCPAALAELAAGLVAAAPDAAIVPGLALTGAGEADVMRGEEVQAFGAVAAGLVPADALLCQPGTHCKWVRLHSGQIVHFRTALTGEMFGLLKAHSLLGAQLQNEVTDSAAFRAGAVCGVAGGDLLHELFALRARHLLGRGDDDAGFASGLLIGSDVRGGLADHDGRPIAVIGRPELAALYVAALTLAGYEAMPIDGEAAFLAGIRALAETW